MRVPSVVADASGGADACSPSAVGKVYRGYDFRSPGLENRLLLSSLVPIAGGLEALCVILCHLKSYIYARLHRRLHTPRGTSPLDRDVLDRILESPRLPSLPTIAVEIIGLAQQDVNMERIAELRHDPALSSKILKTANSAAFGQLQQVSRSLGPSLYSG